MGTGAGSGVGTTSFTMPVLGADMESGTVTEWLVGPGDTVHKGDVVAVIDTAKADIDAECLHSGVVEEILVPTGRSVPVGTPLATLRPLPAELRERAGEGGGRPARRERGRTGKAPRGAPTGPLVRRLAQELGVDLAQVTGTGRGGAITRADVQRAAGAEVSRRREPAPPEPVQQERVPQVPVPQVPVPLEPVPLEPVPLEPVSPRPEPVPRPGERARGIRISPYAARLAAELGVAPATIHGTGPGGAIRAVDVRTAHAREVEAPPSEAIREAVLEPMRERPVEAPALPAPRRPAGARDLQAGARDRIAAMRATTARLMARSKREIPHYYLSTTIDLAEALGWLRGRNLELPVEERIVPAAVLLKATALAADRVPEMNGFWRNDRFEPAPEVNLGVAVSVRGGGLITPALLDVAGVPLETLMARLRDLVGRARSGRLRGAELAAGTLTVTNLGDLGVDSVYGVIYPPQVALVGFGRVVERPWAEGGMLGVRPTVTATLSADHRASDGSIGGRFLAEIARLVARPEVPGERGVVG
ncbi:2-oxo acid dehydrogenase subunit E2 [Actinopolymorpha cephalotaxi]|uniref:Dihydrolipoamide acetyltransferase component of pyruvate dehydrogenase complex n=1 Tax=Actinopolymorpha cephalotaxi TaxID=504797 RepID=A0ABX2SFU6_9ACTN|nr:2-oxo acid dehydrogenase subunit E2 [Actinopolymorpha cephalotaxi]NYH87132.1 pyruvate dehydrogenase E2 component (dihydrolipoamide acetyltransferase) [Actinopolymorpha cephalotaxi]